MTFYLNHYSGAMIKRPNGLGQLRTYENRFNGRLATSKKDFYRVSWLFDSNSYVPKSLSIVSGINGYSLELLANIKQVQTIPCYKEVFLPNVIGRTTKSRSGTMSLSYNVPLRQRYENIWIVDFPTIVVRHSTSILSMWACLDVAPKSIPHYFICRDPGRIS